MPLPAKLTLTGRYDHKHGRALLSGRLTTQTLPTDRIRVALYRIGRQGALWHVATTRTSTDGSYHFVRSIASTTTYLTRVSGVGACTGNSTAPRGCIDQTRGAIDSPQDRIVVPVRRPLN
jgi:hypothetical protein